MNVNSQENPRITFVRPTWKDKQFGKSVFKTAAGFHKGSAHREVPRNTLSLPDVRQAFRCHRSTGFAPTHRPHTWFGHSPRTGGNKAGPSSAGLPPESIATILRCC